MESYEGEHSKGSAKQHGTRFGAKSSKTLRRGTEAAEKDVKKHWNSTMKKAQNQIDCKLDAEAEREA